MTHCRIARVRYKDAPNLSVLIPRPKPGLSDEDIGSMHGCMDRMVEWLKSENNQVGGMVLVAWDMNGRWNRATRYHLDCPIGHTMAPSFVSDILRQDTMKYVVDEEVRGDGPPAGT